MGNSDSRAAGGGDRYVTMELDIQKEKMGKLIGTAGQTIRSIQLRSPNCSVRTPSREDTMDNDHKFIAVTVIGKASDVFKTAEIVSQEVPVCLAVLSVPVESRNVPFLFRDGVKAIQKEVPIDTFKIPRKTDKPPRAVLEGYLEDVVQAYQRITTEVEKAAKEYNDAKEMEKLMAISVARLGDDREGGPDEVRKQQKQKTPREAKERPAKREEIQVTEEIVVPASALTILQKGRLSKIEKATRTQITVGEECRIKIAGSSSNVNRAKRDVERSVKKLEQPYNKPANSRPTKPGHAAAGGDTSGEHVPSAGDAEGVNEEVRESGAVDEDDDDDLEMYEDQEGKANDESDKDDDDAGDDDNEEAGEGEGVR